VIVSDHVFEPRPATRPALEVKMFPRSSSSLAARRILFLGTALLLIAGLAFPLAGAASAAPAACQASYTVQPGDTLYKIGLKYNMVWTKIAAANNIADGNKIFAGQVLCIPAASAVTATPAPTQKPTQAPASKIPLIFISSVNVGQTVTVAHSNFPAGQKFTVRIGKFGTLGVGGTVVATQDSGAGGSFSATYNLPAELKNEQRLAIRLDSASGYYSYNWFWNVK
jgi:LysM repeat protein